MKKKVLIYAHYYAPDVAATGQLLQDLAEEMRGEFDVTVLCVVPSYSGKIRPGWQEKKFYHETINGVSVIRVPVPEFSKNDKKSRILNLLAYYRNARKATGMVGPQDCVFALSQPPILGGLLGVYGKKKLKAKMIYCIQDFNPEQIEATGYIQWKFLLNFVRRLDMRSCRKADLVITVGRDLVETLKKRFFGRSVPAHMMINNWVDEKAVRPLPMEDPGVAAFRTQYGLQDRFVIMYSGNIGLYYDLEGIIRVIEKLRGVKTKDGRDVCFAFVGGGSVKDQLMEYVREHKMDQVVFIPYQKREDLIWSLNAADVHWCVNAKGIKGVSCPSKFYGIAGAGKPVLGVLEAGSEVEMLIREIGCGKCCEPGNYPKIEEHVRWFIEHANSGELKEMGRLGREYVERCLTKSVSVGKYREAIRAL